MTYSDYEYQFRFYKPGKKYFSRQELEKMIKNLESFGFKPYMGDMNDKKKVESKERETDISTISMDIGVYLKQAADINLFLNIEKIDSEIGRLVIYPGHLYYDFDKDDLIPNQFITKASQNLYKMATAITYALEPYFVWGGEEHTLDKLEDHLLFNNIRTLAWMNLFSREFVEKLGGPDKVLLYPNPEAVKEYEKACKTGNYMFIPVALSENPCIEVPREVYDKCLEKFPGFVFLENPLLD